MSIYIYTRKEVFFARYSDTTTTTTPPSAPLTHTSSRRLIENLICYSSNVAPRSSDCITVPNGVISEIQQHRPEGSGAAGSVANKLHGSTAKPDIMQKKPFQPYYVYIIIILCAYYERAIPRCASLSAAMHL